VSIIVYTAKRNSSIVATVCDKHRTDTGYAVITDKETFKLVTIMLPGDFRSSRDTNTLYSNIQQHATYRITAEGWSWPSGRNIVSMEERPTDQTGVENCKQKPKKLGLGGGGSVPPRPGFACSFFDYKSLYNNECSLSTPA